MHVRNLFLLGLILLSPLGFAADALKTEARDLFNGKDLKGWKATEFGGEGPVEIKDGQIVAREGASLSGVQYTNVGNLFTNDYAITMEAMKIDGSDFFVGLTFPVKDSHCTLIMGGWGGGVVGLSSIDSMDASENDSTKYVTFAKNKWYKIRVEIRTERLSMWLDDEKIIDQDIKDKRVSLRPGAIDLQIPFGLSTYQTTAAWRNIRIAPLSTDKAEKEKKP